MTTCCAGQMMNQTLNHMRLPSMPPMKIAQPYDVLKNDWMPPNWPMLVQEIQPARDERHHRAPAEPPERPADEPTGDHAGPHRRLGSREERDLHEVEVVQHPDPGDAGEKVKPAQQEQPSIHLRRLLVAWWATCYLSSSSSSEASSSSSSSRSSSSRSSRSSSSAPRRDRRRRSRRRHRNRRRRRPSSSSPSFGGVSVLGRIVVAKFDVVVPRVCPQLHGKTPPDE